MALFTVSKPKPECSRSNSTNSQPAFFMMWPMPGVANSTMKCPNFGVRVRAMAFRPLPILQPPVQNFFVSGPGASGGRALAYQRVVLHHLVRDQRRALLVERQEV